MGQQIEKKGRPHGATSGRPAKHSIHNRRKRRVFWVANLFVLAGLIGGVFNNRMPHLFG